MQKMSSHMSSNYNSTSSVQLSVVLTSKSYIDEAIENLSLNNSLILIVDYGSAHGLNSSQAMNMIVNSLKEKSKISENHSILVIHNDLPNNDWFSLFNILNSNSTSYFALGSGKSFYEQCFPSHSISIGYSSSSLHWLSKQPCQLRNHCCSAYLLENDPDYLQFAQQSYEDYSQFLKYRSNELIQGGILILSIPSWHKHSDLVDNSSFMHINLLYQCAQYYLTSEELLHFTIPIHVRFFHQCVDDELFQKYSLRLIKCEHVVIQSNLLEQLNQGQINVEQFAHQRALIMKTWTNVSLENALKGNQERKEITNHIWTMYEDKIKEQPQLHNNPMQSTYIILKKI
ncbi:unnamed protein product [Adineta ricciae]|uniref:Uncharacterized protein n=1 Tax=Adineta ricciae TaxID=249248 RepID=A0A816GM24_ADIRI|nr:unnamed protein product [Adineta ricciae]CAF1675789.1 unnamed protein product [Adineta ricciae]